MNGIYIVENDPSAVTRPSVPGSISPPQRKPGRNRHFSGKKINWTGFLSCLSVALIITACVLFTGFIYLLAPIRSNMMILGIDYAPTGNFVGRSDTIVLMTFEPFKPYVGILSVPRDLWVPIPGFGENRINTAHFFAEAQSPGTGPAAVRSTIRENFGLDFKYYLRVKFESFRDIVNAMGGLDIVLTKPMAGYPAGKHHLTGNKALAFARNRIGSDDFFRMERGQLLLKSAINQVIRPTNWRKIPAVLIAFWKSIDTNIPVWLWPRLAVAMIRTGSQGWNAQTIEREMVSPYTTNEGANVLIPNWDLIRAHSNRIFSP